MNGGIEDSKLRARITEFVRRDPGGVNASHRTQAALYDAPPRLNVVDVESLAEAHVDAAVAARGGVRIARASASVPASGFSTNTCLPD